ncbi:MAG: hypothetical protein HOW71_33880 [Nonomuraea sp.]|nr:hypothetical protein [Nonomuraea sp.]NUP67159.1 hypothetical protein [Nonomuraea sp.]
MRRLITSRGIWLALSAVAVAVAAIVVVRRSRTRVVERPPVQAEVAQWPPAPILGTPTAGDRELFAARSASVFDRPGFVRFFQPREPREPLDGAARRRLTRWGAVGVVLVLLAVGAQVFESEVFSKGVEGKIAAPRVVTEETIEPVQEMPDLECRPGIGEPRVRALDPKVTRAVNRQWARIERWLKANAPRTYRTLGRPGRSTTIAVAEAQMGIRFPDDLRASLLRHNGAFSTPGTMGFGFLGNASMSVRQIRDAWRGLCEIDGVDMVESGGPRTEWWDGRMIPVGADGVGDHLVIDSVRRDVGETDHEGNMSFDPGGIRIRSFHALLKATADAMETGGDIGYWRPRAVAGELGWDAG